MQLLKNFLSILLIFVLLFLFTGCKNTNTSDESTVSTPDVSSNVEESIDNSSNNTSTQNSSTSNTSWPSNSFEEMIPEPPFSGWKKEQIDDYTYKMEAANVNAPNYDTSYYKTFRDYAKSLESHGYTVTGETYEFTATDKNGNTIDLLCGDGYAWITINKK